jgi:hypothetical protein
MVVTLYKGDATMIIKNAKLTIPDYDPYNPQSLSRRYQARLLQQGPCQETAEKVQVQSQSPPVHQGYAGGMK